MSLDLPHNYLNYSHCSFVQCIEKIHQHLSFLSHFPNNHSKNKTKDDQPQHIDAIGIHAHDFVLLGFVLQMRFKRKKLLSENTEFTLNTSKMKTYLDLSLKRHGALPQSFYSLSGSAKWASSGVKVELNCL